MKHLFFIYIVLGITSCVVLSAPVQAAQPRQCLTWEYCSVKDETRPEIDIYIENNKIVVKNLTKIVRAEWKKWEPEEGLNRFRQYLVWSINQWADWKRMGNLFEFYVTSAFESSVPEPMYRDHQKLTNEWERIEKLMNMISKQWYNDMIISSERVCEWIQWNCGTLKYALSGNLSDILGRLYKNNLNIKNLFRTVSIGEEQKFEFTTDLFLIPTMWDGNPGLYFSEIIEKYYWSNAVAECNSCSGWWFEQISQGIANITNTLKWQSSGVKSWTDAIALLRWEMEPARKRANERKLLEKELSRQWLNTKNADIILGNLDTYNNATDDKARTWGFSWGNNYISNTYNSFINDTENDLDTFASNIDAQFSEKAEEDPDLNLWNQAISIEELSFTQEKINVSKQISVDVAKLYRLQLEHAQKDDMFGWLLIGRIVDTHVELSESIAILDKTIPIAEHVCNSQAAGKGECSNY